MYMLAYVIKLEVLNQITFLSFLKSVNSPILKYQKKILEEIKND